MAIAAHTAYQGIACRYTRLPMLSCIYASIVQDATAQNIPPGAPSFEIIPHLIPSPFGSIMQDPNDPHFIKYPINTNTFEIVCNSIYGSIMQDPNDPHFIKHLKWTFG